MKLRWGGRTAAPLFQLTDSLDTTRLRRLLPCWFNRPPRCNAKTLRRPESCAYCEAVNVFRGCCPITCRIRCPLPIDCPTQPRKRKAMSKSSAVSKQALQLHNDVQEALKSFQSIAPTALKTSYYCKVLTSTLAATQKSVTIEIAADDLTLLKQSGYKLCFAKKVGNEAYNVVWQSYDKYLSNNGFSWTPQYQLFGSNTFQADVTVKVSTNIVTIGLGQQSILSPEGLLGQAVTGGPDISITLDNEYGPIPPGINQLSVGIDGTQVSTPIYVATNQVVTGNIVLTPVEAILVWFEQNVQTSTMFSTSRSKAIEIDLTVVNDATRRYED